MHATRRATVFQFPDKEKPGHKDPAPHPSNLLKTVRSGPKGGWYMT